ncbi:MAG: tryptophan-rich sensory protein [Vicingaceae bacterium]|nr:tryptophan-rich sensory protein [Vicingaceae bacterium]
MIIRLIIFIAINFGALALGSFFTSNEVTSEWYLNLNKAPWTPPGWVFGAAWTTIMICFGIYMANLWPQLENKSIILSLYLIQLALNIGWNPTFFYFHKVQLGLIVITTLTVLIGYMLFKYSPLLKLKTLLIMPYFIWLLIATSLNAYILFKN